MENQTYKKTRKDIKKVTAQKMPACYVPVSSFEEKYRPYLRKLIDQGRLHALKLAVGRGWLYIHKEEGNEAIKQQKKIDLDKHEIPSKQDPLSVISNNTEVLLSYTFELEKYIRKTSEIYNDNCDKNHRWQQHTHLVLDNLSRHIGIQEVLLFGIIEELGIQKKCFDKKAAKERVKQLSRLITQEDWDEGFEL